MPRRIWIAALVMAIHLATSPRPAGGVGVRGLGRHRMGVSEQAGVLQRRDRLAEAIRARVPADDWQKIEHYFTRKQP